MMQPDLIRYHKFVNLSAALALALAGSLSGQTPAPVPAPIENTGKPMRIPFDCTPADTAAVGLSCSEDEPCPVYLELASVEAAGNRLFITGNVHSSTTTLSSILLASDDAGNTWTEPHARIRAAGLDQIQFIDFQNGWISGANLQTSPRDPFFLLTTDGGKTWRQRPVFDESRVASIERFWFESRENGTMLIDARLDNNRHELYESMTGGESWAMRRASSSPIPLQHAREPGASGWRLRADAASHSYVLEKSQGEKWQKTASFLVDAGACRQ